MLESTVQMCKCNAGGLVLAMECDSSLRYGELSRSPCLTLVDPLFGPDSGRSMPTLSPSEAIVAAGRAVRVSSFRPYGNGRVVTTRPTGVRAFKFKLARGRALSLSVDAIKTDRSHPVRFISTM